MVSSAAAARPPSLACLACPFWTLPVLEIAVTIQRLSPRRTAAWEVCDSGAGAGATLAGLISHLVRQGPDLGLSGIHPSRRRFDQPADRIPLVHAKRGPTFPPVSLPWPASTSHRVNQARQRFAKAAELAAASPALLRGTDFCGPTPDVNGPILRFA